MGRVKEETIKGLFIRQFNRLYSDQKLLKDYKETLKIDDQGQFAILDKEIQNLIKQERTLYIIEGKNYVYPIFLKAEHEKLINALTKLQAERNKLVEEYYQQDSRIAKTLELETIIKAQEGPISEFSEDLYSRIVEKIIVKERTKLVFHLKNGLAFEERYSLGRGHDNL